MKRLFLILASLGALSASGCVVVTDDVDLLDYEPCSFDSDCDSFRCETVEATWPEARVTDSFCTTSCFDSSDCSFTDSGLQGTCASLGGGDFVCYETCDFSSDCAGGFDCGDIGTGDTVCLPR